MFVVYFILWVVFNGKLNLEIAAFGVVLSAAVYAFSCAFLGCSLQKDLALMRLIPRGLRYAWLVICEIFKSNWAMIRIVYSRKPEVEPKLVTFRTPVRDGFKSVLANSITITPGTITVLSQEDSLTVHCLDSQFMDGIENTAFQQQLLEMQNQEEAK